MILEEKTKEAYGYYPSALTPKSHKPILAVCDDCGNVRITSKNNYRALCSSCTKKGKTFTEEHKANISAAQKGNIYALGYKHTDDEKAKISVALKGHKVTEEQKAKQSAAIKGDKNHNFGKRGKESSNYKGGKKVANARQDAKRKKLGYTLLAPLAEGEVGHHVTNLFVIGIPREIHEKLSGYTRRKHRTLVLQWLKANDKNKYALALIILSNETEKQI